MSNVINFALKVPNNIRKYLSRVSLPNGAKVEDAVWRIEDWGTHRNMPETFAFLKSGIKPKSLKNPNSPDDHLNEPWFSSCKAMIIWLRRSKNLSAGRLSGILSATKGLIAFVEENFVDCKSPMQLKTKHINAFDAHLRVKIKEKSLTTGGARLIALSLEKLVLFLNHFNQTGDKIVYKQKFRRPTSSHEYKIVTEVKNDKAIENEIVHKSKLMELDILFALGNLYGECEDDIDRFFLAITLLLAVTGFRVSELLSLKIGCLREYIFDRQIQYEIVYYAEKGGKSLARQITESAVPFVLSCLEVIQTFTYRGHSVAQRIAKENSIVPLDAAIRKSSSTSVREMAEFLGLNPDYVKKLLNESGLTPVISTNYYRTDEMIAALDSHYLSAGIARTNNYEPTVRRLDDGTKIMLNEALFVTLVYETAVNMKTLSFLPKIVSVESYDNWLGNIGKRFNLKDSFGEPVDLNSHQFRHRLQTMYEDGGFTDVELARMFGRKDTKQNRDYRHLTDRQRRENLYKYIRENNSVGIISDTYKKLRVISEDDAEQFLKSVVEAVHLTEYGACTLDWARHECPHHMSCLSGKDGIACRNLVIMKGDLDALAKVEKELEREEIFLQKAIKSGSPFSSDWIKNTQHKVENLKKIVALHKQQIIDSKAPEPAFAFSDGITPDGITRNKDNKEMRRSENR